MYTLVSSLLRPGRPTARNFIVEVLGRGHMKLFEKPVLKCSGVEEIIVVLVIQDQPGLRIRFIFHL